jgi:2'-5' RNA ligase
MDVMRLFIALDIPDSAKEMLGTLQQRLMTLGVGGRSVPTNTMHITLRYFEHVPDSLVDLIAQVVQAEGDSALAPLLTVNGIGGFVRSGGDTVYARMGGDTDALTHMEQRISAALLRRGVTQEPRPFFPHITLMRGVDYRTANQLTVKSDIFFATNLTLYRSVTTEGPPVYDALLSIPLPR